MIAERISVCAGLVLLGMTPPALAWSILDEVTVLDPSLTAEVIWEMPSAKTYCESLPESLDRLDCALRVPEEFWIGVDAAGNRYGAIKTEQLDGSTFFEIHRRPRGTPLSEPVLRVTARVEPVFGQPTKLQVAGSWEVDAAQGDLLLSFRGQCLSAACAAESDVEEHLATLRVGGLPELFDIACSFVPSGALSCRVPAVPEGLPTGSSLDVYSGELASLPDLSQAEPLGCDVAPYALPGEYLTFVDPRPDPPPGTGRYYLVVTVAGAERRAGRQRVDGQFSGREANALPGCTLPGSTLG
jgi:hypothetical protein